MKNCLLKKISEKESELELGISAYMVDMFLISINLE